MTHVNKSKQGRIGPEPKPGIILPPPSTRLTQDTVTHTVGASIPKKKKKTKKTKKNG
jgi:hypothetical protein